MERTLESALAPSLGQMTPTKIEDKQIIIGASTAQTAQSDSDDYDEYSDQFEEDDEEDESAMMGSTGQSAKLFKGKTPESQQLNRNALEQQVAQYKQMLDITGSGFSQYQLTSSQAVKQQMVVQSPSLSSQKSKNTESRPILTMKARHEQQKNIIRQKMTPDLYDRVYKILVMSKNQDCDSHMIQEHLKQVKRMSKEMKDLVFSLEQIVFMEE